MSAFSQMQTFRDNAVADYERVLAAHRDQSMSIADVLEPALGLKPAEHTPESLAAIASKRLVHLESIALELSKQVKSLRGDLIRFEWHEEVEAELLDKLNAPIHNTHTNFGALRGMMEAIKSHRQFMASDAPADHKEISDDMFLEWNKGHADELTHSEWNIVKAHLSR